MARLSVWRAPPGPTSAGISEAERGGCKREVRSGDDRSLLWIHAARAAAAEGAAAERAAVLKAA
jgi:hypothetical protein